MRKVLTKFRQEKKNGKADTKLEAVLAKQGDNVIVLLRCCSTFHARPSASEAQSEAYGMKTRLATFCGRRHFALHGIVPYITLHAIDQDTTRDVRIVRPRAVEVQELL